MDQWAVIGWLVAWPYYLDDFGFFWSLYPSSGCSREKSFSSIPLITLLTVYRLQRSGLFIRSGYNENQIKEKKNYNFLSLFVEQITSSCFAVARLRGLFACAGVYPWTTARSRSGRIYAVRRVLFRQGNNSRGYYFAKEIVAFNSRDQRPSFDPEGNRVDLRSDLSRTPALFGVDDRRAPDLDVQVLEVPKLESC